MSFKIIASDNFKKEAKRLIKKYVSLKLNWKYLGRSFQKNQHLELLLEITATNYVLLSLQRERGNQVVAGSLLMCR